MENDVVNDGTDAFDARLEVLRKRSADKVEVDAAIAVYERLRTAKAICQALLPGDASALALAAVAAELRSTAQSGQSLTLRA